MASAVHYVHLDKVPELWINEVGVAPSHQRQGIGRRLLEALLQHGRALGCAETWVLTEEENAPTRQLTELYTDIYTRAAQNQLEEGVQRSVYLFQLALLPYEQP